MKIAIINGPNLNLLGKREPEIYGSISFEDHLIALRVKFPGVDFTYFQSNVEGELIDELQRADKEADGIILNAAGYTHTSVALGDAIGAISTMVIEVHISNIYAREDFRKLSHVSAKAAGTITGLGLAGYDLAVQWFLKK